MIYSLYPQALDCGILPELFWSLSPAEIEDMIESYYRALKIAEKRKIEQLFLAAEAIASRVALLFSSEKDSSAILQPWHAYPELFEKEKDSADEYEEQKQLEAYKAAMRQRAAAMNTIMGEKEYE